MSQRRSSFFVTLTAMLVGLVFSSPMTTHAGCGCDKPPPLPASVRPTATYQGMPVTLFSSSLQAGVTYNVTFTSVNGQNVTVSSQAVNRRDLADSNYKLQLAINLPALPLGPASISVLQVGQTGALLAIADTSFTVVPKPVAVPNQPGSYSYQNFQAAVGRDGRVYISLDLTGMSDPRTFQATAKGWPLRFTNDDAVFYNVQGFLMQMVNAPIPGLATINPGNSSNSDTLQYQRHEFNTYVLQHDEHQPHATDPTDGNWHLDGTRHVDHDHLILAIAGKVNGATPAPGATSAFTLEFKSYSFFQHGLVGLNGITLNSSAFTDSYNSVSGLPSANGDILSNGSVMVNDKAIVNGNATAASFTFNGAGKVTGQKTISTTPVQFIPVSMPKGLASLSNIHVPAGGKTTISVGSYNATGILIDSTGNLFIDNAAGPVTLYVSGAVQVNTGGKITVADPNPEKFAIYVAGTSPVQIDAGSSFYGVVYAPQSSLRLTSNGHFYGAFVGQSTIIDSLGKFHYDTALRGQ